MIYLIGGPPRVGKTTLAKLIWDRHRIPPISTDGLRAGLEGALRQSGLPERKAQREEFHFFLEPFIEETLWQWPDMVIEGTWVLPELVAKLSTSPKLKETGLKVVFLGMGQVSLDRMLFFGGAKDWLKYASEDERRRLPRYIIEKSAAIQGQAKEHGFPYFDLGGDRDGGLEQAYEALMGGRPPSVASHGLVPSGRTSKLGLWWHYLRYRTRRVLRG